MPTLTSAPQEPIFILFLAEDENASNLDRRTLRAAGFNRVRVMTSGIDAARLLAGMDADAGAFRPDLVICLSQLADMDGEQFCAIIRQHPRLLGLPILLILPNDNEAAQMRALGCGASALMGRPFSVDSLRQTILRLAHGASNERSLRKAASQADTSAFDEALATYGVLLRSERQPEDYFRVGMRCLEENRWPMAIAAFERALHDAHIRAEAELGIAAAYRGKGDMARFKAWLARASESFLRAKRWNRARAAYAKLLQHDPSAKNPFLAEAHRLIRKREYEDAATVLAQGVSLLSKQNAGERYARVCLAAEDPLEMLAALEESLERDAGGKYDFLGQEVRESLAVMTKQREERQRRQTEERKMRLAREMRAQALGRNPAAEDAGQSIELAQPVQKPKDNFAPQRAQALGRNPATEDASQGIELAQPVQKPKDNFAPQSCANVIAEFGAPNPEPAGMAFERASDSGQDVDNEPVLQQFGEKAEKDELFGKKTKLNELLSVVKLTWKLSRKAAKHS